MKNKSNGNKDLQEIFYPSRENSGKKQKEQASPAMKPKLNPFVLDEEPKSLNIQDLLKKLKRIDL